MKRFLHHSIVGLLLFSSCLNEGDAPLGEYETFIRYFGDGADEVAVQVKELTEGNIAMLSNTELGANQFKISLTITDQFGHKIWDFRGPSNGNFRANSFLLLSNGNFLITGDEIIDNQSFLMLIEIGSSGTLVKSQTFAHPTINIIASASVRGKGMTLNNTNDLLIVSDISNNGDENMLLQLINLNTTGDWTVAWSHAYGSDESTLAKRLFLNNNNSVVWGGTVRLNNQNDFRLTAAPKDSQNPEFDLPIGTPDRNEEGNDICKFAGGYVIVGNTELPSGTTNIKLVRTTENGSVLFEKEFGNERNDSGKSVAATMDGSLVVFGNTQTLAGTNSYYLIKLDSFGNILWEEVIGSSHVEDAVDVIQGSEGSFIACGTTNFGGLKVAMLMKTTSEGKIF